MPSQSVPPKHPNTGAESGAESGADAGLGPSGGPGPDVPEGVPERSPGRGAVAVGLAAFAAGAGAGVAAVLGGAIIGGLSALTISGISGRLAAANLVRDRRSDIGLRRAVRFAVLGAIFPVAATFHTSGLTALLTALLAALLSLLLVPSVCEILRIPKGGVLRAYAPERSNDQLPSIHPTNEAPDGLDHRGGTGVWGYGFRRAYNPVTGESGEWLGPGLVRKSDDSVVKVDTKGRPFS
jgi:hypothetical protein